MDTEQSHGRLGAVDVLFAGTRAVDGSGHRCGTNECSGCSGCTEKQLFLKGSPNSEDLAEVAWKNDECLVPYRT